MEYPLVTATVLSPGIFVFEDMRAPVKVAPS